MFEVKWGFDKAVSVSLLYTNLFYYRDKIDKSNHENVNIKKTIKSQMNPMYIGSKTERSPTGIKVLASHHGKPRESKDCNLIID